MDLGKTFRMDEEMAEQGVWVTVDGDGSKILVAAMPNAALARHMAPLYRRYRQLRQEIPDAVHDEALAKFVLLSWEGISEDGQLLAPTEENRLKMLRAYQPFKTLVIQEATDIANFQRAAEEEERKNS